MGITTLKINIDSDLNEKAQKIFLALGTDISTAVNMFLKHTVYQGEISFDVKLKQKKRVYSSRYIIKPDTSKTPIFGCMKDSMEVPSNFDEPLDEMMEYMY
jgi:addiction module RelB/DinJ family antitoxin